ncbi:MAG: SIS domain-containing protein, partial [Planctomycetes bacterium]|nr:SIS domain-containing protein [Planctomycetota bacterium]
MAAMQARIAQELRESINAKMALMRECVPTIYEIADRMATALSEGHAVYLMGNGGSAADAQHIAGELVGRFKKERRA